MYVQPNQAVMKGLQSPQGGTTSLPQYLQQRQQQPTKPAQPNTSLSGATGAAQQAQPSQPTVTPPKTQTTSAAPAAPNVTPVGTQSTNVSVPPPPPPAAPSPAAPPAPLSGLQQTIADQIKNPGAYGSPEIEAMRKSGMQNLEDLRRSEEDRLTANAASRGVLRGSGLSTSLGDLSERYVRGAQDLEADLMEKAANSRQTGLQQAIQNALGFGQGELANNQFLANLQLALMQMGMQGGPTIPGAVGDYNSMPIPQPGDNSWIYQVLGSTYPQQKAA